MDDKMKLMLVVGGGALAYWYVVSYGPSGPVKNAQGQKVAPSYWDLWFGGAVAGQSVQAAGAAGAATYTPTPGTPTASIPATATPTITPATGTAVYSGSTSTTTGNGSAAGISTNGLVVAPDINHSLTGYVQLNGQTTRLSIIIPGGQVYDVNGQEVTNQLMAMGVDVAALIAAFKSAPRGPVAGVDAQYAQQYPDLLQVGLSGIPMPSFRMGNPTVRVGGRTFSMASLKRATSPTILMPEVKGVQ